jgi:RecG-like helicase
VPTTQDRPAARRPERRRAEGSRPGPWRRLTASLTQSKADQHAAALQVGVRDTGATPIAACTAGTPATVTGVLRSVTLRPREGVPAVEAELFDGSGRLTIVWLGRRRIRGIEPGRTIVVHGRVTGNTERPTIFNPRYELRAPGWGRP